MLGKNIKIKYLKNIRKKRRGDKG